jgi:hypothetical protein
MHGAMGFLMREESYKIFRVNEAHELQRKLEKDKKYQSNEFHLTSLVENTR